MTNCYSQKSQVLLSRRQRHRQQKHSFLRMHMYMYSRSKPRSQCCVALESKRESGKRPVGEITEQMEGRKVRRGQWKILHDGTKPKVPKVTQTTKYFALKHFTSLFFS